MRPSGGNIPRKTQAELDAISSPKTGKLYFNTTTVAYQFWNGTSWVELDTAGGATIILEWQPSTLYAEDAVVTESNILYQRISTGTSGLSFDAAEKAQWNLIGAGSSITSDISYYVDGDVGDDSNDGLSWGTAKKTNDFLYSGSSNALPRIIAAVVSVYERGTILAPNTSRHTVLDGFIFAGNGEIKILGETDTIGTYNVTSFSNNPLAQTGYTFLQTDGSFAPSVHSRRFVKMIANPNNTNDLFPIDDNTADTLNVWHVSDDVSTSTDIEIVEAAIFKSATVSDPGTYVDFDTNFFKISGCSVPITVRNIRQDSLTSHRGQVVEYCTNIVDLNNEAINSLNVDGCAWVNTDHVKTYQDTFTSSGFSTCINSTMLMKDTWIGGNGTSYGFSVQYNSNIRMKRCRISGHAEGLAGDKRGGSFTIEDKSTLFDSNTVAINGGSLDIAIWGSIRLVDCTTGFLLSNTNIYTSESNTHIQFGATTGIVIGNDNYNVSALGVSQDLSNKVMGVSVQYLDPTFQLVKFDDNTPTTSQISNWDAAHTHSLLTSGNPHNNDKSDVGLGNVQNVDQTNASNITSGTLSNDRLALSGVVSGTYQNADVTVNDKGIITSIANGDAGLTITKITFDITDSTWSGGTTYTETASLTGVVEGDLLIPKLSDPFYDHLRTNNKILENLEATVESSGTVRVYARISEFTNILSSYDWVVYMIK